MHAEGDEHLADPVQDRPAIDGTARRGGSRSGARSGSASYSGGLRHLSSSVTRRAGRHQVTAPSKAGTVTTRRSSSDARPAIST